MDAIEAGTSLGHRQLDKPVTSISNSFTHARRAHEGLHCPLSRSPSALGRAGPAIVGENQVYRYEP